MNLTRFGSAFCGKIVATSRNIWLFMLGLEGMIDKKYYIFVLLDHSFPEPCTNLQKSLVVDVTHSLLSLPFYRAARFHIRLPVAGYMAAPAMSVYGLE